VSLSVDWAAYAGSTTECVNGIANSQTQKLQSWYLLYFVNSILVYLNLYSNKVKLATLFAKPENFANNNEMAFCSVKTMYGYRETKHLYVFVSFEK